MLTEGGIKLLDFGLAKLRERGDPAITRSPLAIGRYEDAIAACRRSAALVPSWDACNNWGMTLYRLRRFGEAVEKLEAARKVGPDSYQLVGNLARAEYDAGRRLEAQARYRDAIALGERALGVNPRDEDTNVSVAGFYSKIGDRDRAVARCPSGWRQRGATTAITSISSSSSGRTSPFTSTKVLAGVASVK